MKTIIHVFTQKSKNNNDLWGYWGLGDLIRGTIHLHQLSKKMNFKLIVDYQLHPISEFLKENKHEYSDFIKQKENDIIALDYGCSKSYILNNNENVLYFLTNDFFVDDISYDTKEFIKNLLEPIETFNNEILNIKNNLKSDFNILHFRLGNVEKHHNLIINKLNSINPELFVELLSNVKFNNLLITDSDIFKEKIKNLNNINTLNTNITHLGYSNDIKDTLLEFYIMQYASKIYTYSIFIHNNGISGFVYHMNKIYDIPVIRIIHDYDSELDNNKIMHHLITYHTFDWKLYISKCPDLKHFNSKNAAWKHWNLYGKKENRYFLF
jgi:hypothetical protein